MLLLFLLYLTVNFFSSLFRLTINSYLSDRIKVIDPLDRQKIVLNVLDLIVFQNNRKAYSGNNPIIILLVIILLSLLYTIKKWRDNIKILHQTMNRIEYLKESTKSLTEGCSSSDGSRSSSSLSSENKYNIEIISLKDRKMQLLKEIAVNRERVKLVEKLLDDDFAGEYSAFDRLRLQKFLQLSFELESKLLSEERETLEREIMVRQIDKIRRIITILIICY